MNVKNLLSMVAVGAGCSVVTEADAKTVALWSLGEGTSASLGACAIDSRNDLTVSAPSGGWETQARFATPALPGAVKTPTMFRPVTERCLVRTEASSAPLLASSSAWIVQAVSGTRDFTLEGYVKFGRTLGTEWWALARGGNREGTQESLWTFRLNKKNTAELAFELCGFGSDQSFDAIDDTVSDFCSVWHHFALVFRTGTTQSSAEVFFDGVSCGTRNLTRKDFLGTAPHFDIGGRYNESSHTFLGGFDMWRLSDAALAPTDFLNAASPEWKDIPAAADASKTVAYWPLTRRSDGSLDARDVANGNDLSSGYFPAKPYFAQVVPDADGAPLDGNRGDWRFLEGMANTALTATNVAQCLDVASSFAVEMYLKPRHRTATVATSQWICSTTGNNSNNRGWILLYVKRADGWRFELVACNGGEQSPLGRDIPLSDYMNDWGETWRKIRLERDAVAGTWRLLIDGKSGPVMQDAVQVVAGTAPADLTLGGRPNRDTAGFAGSIDDLKLYDAEGDVSAHWPLDVTGGADLDGTAKVGSVKLTAKELKYTGTSYLPTAVEDANVPVVSNPDAAARQGGYAVRGTGCAAFQDKSSGMGYQYLATSAPGVADALNGDEGFTLEFWMNRTYSLGSSWEGLFFFFNGQEGNSGGAIENGTALATIAVQSDKFLVEDAGSFSSSKCDMTDKGDVWTLAKTIGWHHWAFVHDKSEEKSRWRIYVDGALKSTQMSDWNVSAQNIRCLTLGGRYPSNKAFRGRMANVRLSRGVLATTEFLNATGTPAPVAEDAATLAYWPLDAQSVGATQAEPSGYDLTEASGTVAWSSEKARGRVALQDFPYERRNVGSLELGEDGSLGSLSKSDVLSGSFTVEGWFKAAGASTDGVLVTTDTGSGGWTLSLSETAAGAVFTLRNGYGAPYTPTVSAAFPAVPAAHLDDWMHVALSHDLSAGCGTWRLTVNGEVVGTLSDGWRDVSRIQPAQIALGGGSAGTAAGLYDMWRLSRGVLGAGQLMWSRKPGFTILFR